MKIRNQFWFSSDVRIHEAMVEQLTDNISYIMGCKIDEAWIKVNNPILLQLKEQFKCGKETQ